MPSKLSIVAAFVGTLTVFGSVRADTQTQPAATFRSSVDLVRISAVVRDHKGRFVQDLSSRDFEVLDDGQARAITDFRADLAGVSVAFLFDVSGSMEAKMPNARKPPLMSSAGWSRKRTRRQSSRSTRVSIR